ncbi:TRAP transporter large permease [Halodurantibacterium flavum]|uniref:TRAP transporter large permease protein n=1 Tax=Halodurantibacterium flavum TaxID=1382802 RepID=A0ABW4S2Q2_9RHOB
MSNLAIGFAGFAAIVGLIGLRFHVGLALIIVAFTGLMLITNIDIALSMLRVLPYDFVTDWDLSAVPMFLLMGAIAHRSGMTASLFDVARLWFSRMPGGLAVATNFACAGFSSASGSSLATTMAIGRITIPEMRKYHYDPGLAAGIVACGGTLGVLIPPSIILVLYGIFAEVSIAKLFMAGVLPGLLTAGVYFGQIVLRCWLNPSLAPPVPDHPSWSERLRALRTIWPLPLLILAVIGGIYTGIATPTEAGALGAFLALLIALAQRRMTVRIFRQAARESIMATASIFFVAIGALLLTRFMAFSGVPMFLAGLVADYSVDTTTMILITLAIYLVLGMFLDPLGMMLLTLPVMLPMFQAAGMDLIWFGILMVKFIEIGLITPPVGLNVYAVKLLAPDYKLQEIFRGALWFLLAEILIIGLLITFPQITLFLPSIM